MIRPKLAVFLFTLMGAVGLSLPRLVMGDTAAVPPQASNPAKAEARTIWTQDTLLGDWGGERQKLADRGFTITPSWSNEVFGNPTGGFRQGVVDSGLLSLALDLDTLEAHRLGGRWIVSHEFLLHLWPEPRYPGCRRFQHRQQYHRLQHVSPAGTLVPATVLAAERIAQGRVHRCRHRVFRQQLRGPLYQQHLRRAPRFSR